MVSDIETLRSLAFEMIGSLTESRDIQIGQREAEIREQRRKSTTTVASNAF
jgi:hypothetical protein